MRCEDLWDHVSTVALAASAVRSIDGDHLRLWWTFHMLKFTPTAVLTIGMLSLSGCTASDTQRVPPSLPPTPTAATEQELSGEGAIFLSEFVQEHPGHFDPDLLPGSFLFAEAGIGPAEYPLPALSADSDQLVLTIFCDDATEYEVALTSGGEIVDRTWGDSCDADGLVNYKTAPIDADRSSLSAAVTVDEKASFRMFDSPQ
ncbi:hypothetical protein BHD05_08055 [Marisediminicola antarctica]|uniref:Uncharacterized protein n=1 Tax=Marisediminicola antarctica TaxID=674079 RepID=A0A7L5AH42_9MICO|nr:hypothetical protein BHD05_08055 [Marisediminicola antarctica]